MTPPGFERRHRDNIPLRDVERLLDWSTKYPVLAYRLANCVARL